MHANATNNHTKLKTQNKSTLVTATAPKLDEKVAVLGPAVVEGEVAELRAMQRLLQQACASDDQSSLPESGKQPSRYSAWRDCLWKDQGCGHRCILRWASMYEAERARQQGQQ